jgi:hypothetical protein
VDLDAVIFNPRSLTILKWLRFKDVSLGHAFGLAQPVVWNCFIVGLGLLLLGLFDCWHILVHHIQSLACVTMVTSACNLL